MNRFYLVLIGAMALYIFFLQACNGGNNKTIGDGSDYFVVKTAKMKVPEYTEVIKPKIIKEYLPSETIYDTIPYTDSNYCKALASSYYTTRVYNDTIQGDTCDLYVKARVYGNELDSVQLGYKLNIPLVTVEEYKPRIQVFLAGNVGTNLKGFSAGPEIIIKDKRDFLYKGGVSFNTDGNPLYHVGFGFKLSFRKRVR